VAVESELARLRAENARLLKLLRLTPQQAAPPGPAQGAFFEAAPGIVHHRSPQDAKVAIPDPRKLPYTPSASTARPARPEGPVL
jgi:hypothetical protein